MGDIGRRGRETAGMTSGGKVKVQKDSVAATVPALHTDEMVGS